MLAYYCSTCNIYLTQAEAPDNKRCPNCKTELRPRMVLGGTVMGSAPPGLEAVLQRGQEVTWEARKKEGRGA